MKIAVTSLGESLESPIDQRFGRARFFVIYNLESGEWSVSKNFITLIHPGDFRNNLEFQFAVEKGDLKFLKKD
jgi:hypothetical protein